MFYIVKSKQTCCGIILFMARFRGFIFLSVMLLIVSLSACQQSSTPTKERQEEDKGEMGGLSGKRRLKVLTTFAPLYCFAINITGDLADVENLLPLGVGPHEYSFSPLDIKKVTEAQVIIKNGVNLENWLDKLIASAGKKKLIIVDTSSGIEVINNNPHIWLSPRNVIIQVKNITEALVKIDPAHGNVYKGNAEKYIQRLQTLDAEIHVKIGKLERKGFVVFHSAFLYFAKDYGVKQLAVIQESPEKESSPKHIADVIKTIKTENVKAIFSETGVTSKIVDAIAKDLNLQIYSLDTLERGEIYPEWYEDRIRANLAVLRKALK